MISFFIQYWRLLVVFCGGIILTLLIQGRIKTLFKSFYSKAPLIKKYWVFVVPFTLVSLIIYALVVFLSPLENLDTNLTILNQATTLLFAIFVGYFAFQQVVEYRLDKLKGQANLYFKQPSYLRAIQYYEEAYSINPKDFSLLAELLEVYLCIGEFKKFDEKIGQLEKLTIEDYEKSTIAYLKVCEHLFKQDLGSAKTELKSYIDLVQKDPEVLEQFRWDFSDIRKCDLCKKLDGEVKTIFENLVNYLHKSLGEEKKKRFETGDYLLKEEKKEEK